MIQGCVIYFNDGPDLLKRCLLSLKGKVDRILAIDGRWRGFKSDDLNSTDGCYECAKEIADEVIRPKEPWYNQISKRNAYLTLDNQNDFYLVLDADEYIDGYIDNNQLTEDFYSIKLVTDGDNGTDQVRMFRNIEGLKYKQKHSWLWLNDKIVNQEPNAANIHELKTLKIFHTPNIRPEDRQIQDQQYAKDRREPDEIPLNQYPFKKASIHPLKDTKIKCMFGKYNGFDCDSVWFQLVEGQEITISKQKAFELVNEKDYNGQFKIVRK